MEIIILLGSLLVFFVLASITNNFKASALLAVIGGGIWFSVFKLIC